MALLTTLSPPCKNLLNQTGVGTKCTNETRILIETDVLKSEVSERFIDVATTTLTSPSGEHTAVVLQS